MTATTVVSQTKLDKTDTVYNFTVDEFHTYHIGELGVWVHNSCYEEAVTRIFSNQNKFHHFVHGSKNSVHNWELLVPNLNKNDLSKIAIEVLENGRNVPYKGGTSKVFAITRNGVTKDVQIPYVVVNGKIEFSTGWVLP